MRYGHDGQFYNAAFGIFSQHFYDRPICIRNHPQPSRHYSNIYPISECGDTHLIVSFCVNIIRNNWSARSIPENKHEGDDFENPHQLHHHRRCARSCWVRVEWNPGRRRAKAVFARYMNILHYLCGARYKNWNWCRQTTREFFCK